MTDQRKRIKSAHDGQTGLFSVKRIVDMGINDVNKVNIHGLHITMGCAPVDPEEVFLGRWYVVLLPNSIAHTAATESAWLAELSTVSLANNHLSASSFVWGSGSIICSDATPFNLTFKPSTTRNAQKGSRLYLLMVADDITGILDNWGAVATMTFFT